MFKNTKLSLRNGVMSLLVSLKLILLLIRISNFKEILATLVVGNRSQRREKFN